MIDTKEIIKDIYNVLQVNKYVSAQDIAYRLSYHKKYTIYKLLNLLEKREEITRKGEYYRLN